MWLKLCFRNDFTDGNVFFFFLLLPSVERIQSSLFLMAESAEIPLEYHQAFSSRLLTVLSGVSKSWERSLQPSVFRPRSGPGIDLFLQCTCFLRKGSCRINLMHPHSSCISDMFNYGALYRGAGLLHLSGHSTFRRLALSLGSLESTDRLIRNDRGLDNISAFRRLLYEWTPEPRARTGSQRDGLLEPISEPFLLLS